MSFLILAYAAAWLGLFAYTLMLSSRQRRLASELQWLEDLMDKGAGKASTPQVD